MVGTGRLVQRVTRQKGSDPLRARRKSGGVDVAPEERYEKAKHQSESM